LDIRSFSLLSFFSLWKIKKPIDTFKIISSESIMLYLSISYSKLKDRISFKVASSILLSGIYSYWFKGLRFGFWLDFRF
jgi:hypothetical protein